MRPTPKSEDVAIGIYQEATGRAIGVLASRHCGGPRHVFVFRRNKARSASSLKWVPCLAPAGGSPLSGATSAGKTLGVFMSGILGPVIVLVLGLTSGAVFHTVWRRFWAATAVATLSGTLLWVGGCYLFLALWGSSEDLGPPLIEPVLLTIVTALVGVLVAGCTVRVMRVVNHRLRLTGNDRDRLLG